jgi:dienelactone hydrolase
VRTWTQALVVLPSAGSDGEPLMARRSARELARAVNRLPRGAMYPTVVFLHGCTGIGNLEFLRDLGRHGFAVVAPDSFARRYRPLQCDPDTQRGGRNLFVYDFRSAELTYALERIHQLPWVDLENLFLIGASEGGVTAALFRANVFNARVIVQWTCAGAPLVEGIDAPRDTPILAIVRENDPYYVPTNTPGQQGHCGLYMDDRVAGRSLILPAASGPAAHDVLVDPEAMDAIVAFLNEFKVSVQ